MYLIGESIEGAKTEADGVVAIDERSIIEAK